jgi:hypothetical protein
MTPPDALSADGDAIVCPGAVVPDFDPHGRPPKLLVDALAGHQLSRRASRRLPRRLTLPAR